MIDGSDSGAPANLPECSSQSEVSRPVQAAGKTYTCSSCGEPTKGHFGPYGQSKCFIGRLMARVDELERDREAKDACIRDMEQLNSKRQEGLLATIDVLQEEVQNLTNRLGELEKDRSTGPCVCDEQKSQERNVPVNPEPPSVVSPIPPLDVTPASLSAKVDDASLGGETRKEQHLKKEEQSRKNQETQGPRNHVPAVDGIRPLLYAHYNQRAMLMLVLRCGPTPAPFQRTSPDSSKFVDKKTKESLRQPSQVHPLGPPR